MHARHEPHWRHDICRHCGITANAVANYSASPNCDIIRGQTTAGTVIPVIIGILFAAYMLAGLFA